MAKRHKTNKRSTKCPEPFNTLLDIAGAAALGAIVKSRVKRDFARGQGEASAKAAATVYGAGAFRKGSAGTINLGGLMGLNSALRELERINNSCDYQAPTPYSESFCFKDKPSIRKNLWRDHCEDGSAFGIDPNAFETPDDYYDALFAAKQANTCVSDSSETIESDNTPIDRDTSATPKNVWRNYCTDGTPYGICPEDYHSADDYEDAIAEAKIRMDNNS